MNEDAGLVRSAVAYPFSGSAGTRFVFGAVLYFFGVVVTAGGVVIAVRSIEAPDRAFAVVALALLVWLPVFGYAGATIRAVLDEETDPPAFGGWRALVADGRRLGVVVLAYAAPFVVTVSGAAILSDGGSFGSGTLSLLVAGAGYGLVAAYVLPAAVVSTVHEGRANAAWEFATLREAVVDHRYASGWVVATLVALIGGTIGVATSLFVVGFAVLFATQVAATYAVTRGVVAALDLALADPPAPPASGYVPGAGDDTGRKELTDGRLGGSLLPTTPGDDEGDDVDHEEQSSTAGPLATMSEGGDATSDTDHRTEGSGVATSTGSETTDANPELQSGTDEGGSTSDITPFDESDSDHDADEDSP